MAASSNLVHETTTSTGSTNLTLTNESGKQSFNTAFSTGGTDVFYYFISHRGAAEWEVGTGHLSTSTTLVRDTVIASTNANAAVNFSAGTKDVMSDIPYSKQIINPLTTRGDLIRQGASSYERVALGTSGYYLRSDGTDAVWSLGNYIKSGGAVNTDTSVASITDVTIFNPSISVAAGDLIFVEAWGTILNNSAASRIYSHSLSLGSLTIGPLAMPNSLATSATNRLNLRIGGCFAVSASNLARGNVFVDAHTATAADAGGDSGATSVVGTSGWDSTTSDITGTQTLSYAVKSNSATATQTFTLLGYAIKKIGSI